MRNPYVGAKKQTQKIAGIKLSHTFQLSDDAFYLIALAILLKKRVKPVTVIQFLRPGNGEVIK